MSPAIQRPRRVVSTLLFGSALSLLVACGGAERAGTDATPNVAASREHPAWSRDAVIYEVNVRQYTPEGTFAALQKQLPRLDSLGVDILWLMPVQPIGVAERKGGLGSYYAIRDYTAINPEHGTADDARAFIRAAQALGMRVILDWVANHTAFDHEWTVTHPEFYTKNENGGISVALDDQGRVTDWTDVAELDYDNTAMREAMLGEMRWWVDSMGIDGFRCDVAGGVPDDFWATADSLLTAAKPELFMLAEAEGPRFHRSFDATYAWELHHVMNRIARGEEPTTALDAYFAKEAATYPADAYRMTFTSNHDENSWNGTEFERMGANHQAAFVLLSTVANSFPLLYSGQEVSLNKRLRFFDKDTIDWNGPSLADFYARVFALRHAQPALRNGSAGGPMTILAHDGGERVFAFARVKDDDAVVVLTNFGDADAGVAYRGLPAPGDYTDWFSGESLALTADGTVTVPAHGWRVLARPMRR